MPTAATAAELLAALSGRLVAARTPSGPPGNYQYPLNDQVLPAGEGSPDAVRTALLSALIPSGQAVLALTAAGEPVLTPATPGQPDQLVLGGTSAVLTAAPVSTTVVFTVSAAGLLQATWTITMTDGWSLADVFTILDGTGFGSIRFTAASYVATTYAHTDPACYFPLTAGLHFQGTFPVRADLQPALTATGPGAATLVRIGGPLSLAPDGRPQFNWTAEAPLAALTIPLPGLQQVSLASGVVALSSAPASDHGGNQNELVITGTATVAGVTATCRLDLPTTAAGGLTLRASSIVPSPAKLGVSVLTDLGLWSGYLSELPPELIEVGGVRVAAYSVAFTPGRNLPVIISATLTFGTSAWEIANTASVSDFALQLTVIRAWGTAPAQDLGARAEVRGKLRLLSGGDYYAMRAVLTQENLWYLEFTGNTAPSLDDLALNFNFSRSQVTGTLPPSLPGLAGLGVSRLALLADADSQELRRLDVTLAQTQPWPLAGNLVTLSGWTADLTGAATAAGGWTTTGRIGGTIELTPGDSATALTVSVPVPPGPDQLLELRLAEGPVRLPSIGEILRLLGARRAALPAAFSTLGALDITQFTVSFDLAATTLRHIGFAVSQGEDWTIPLTGGTVTISGVAAALSFAPDTTPVGVSGQISGTLMLAGNPVDIIAVKNGYDGGWMLRAAVEHYVHVPDFTALDGWLSPDKASGGVPATLARPSGLDIGNLFLEFAEGQNGALRTFGFTVQYTDQWDVVPGHLALTSIEADLALTVPVTSTADVSGTVTAVVTLGDVDLGVSASKPANQEPWEFTGRLLAGRTIDLVAGVNSLASAPRALPADAASHGLPDIITIADVAVRAIPDTGLFHFAGRAALHWPLPLGNAAPVVTEVSGSADIAVRGGPLSAALACTLTLGSLQVRLELAIGDASQDTVLTGALTSLAAQQLQIADVTDPVATASAADHWAAVVPADLTALHFTSADAYLNLTRSQFLIYGGMTAAGDSAAHALAYLAGDDSHPAQWSYAVAVSFGAGFQFAALAPALSVIDQHLQVTQARLVVCNLRSGTLGALAKTTTDLLGTLDPHATSPLAGLTGDAQALATGAYVAATVDISPASGDALLSRVVQIGRGPGPSTLSVLALIDKATPASTQFTADLPDITILDTITLTHSGTHPGIHLGYRPAAGNAFTLDGRLQIAAFGSSYGFDVTLTVDNTGLTSTARQTTQAITHPFQLPGIVVTDLSVTAAYTWAVPARQTAQTSEFTITGKVRLGPEPAPGTQDQRPPCATSLVLLAGAPALADVTLAGDLDIGAFLAQCLTGSGANWPAQYIDLTLAAGSRVYYHSRTADPDGKLSGWGSGGYGYGFQVDAELRLTLLTQLTLRGTLAVEQDATTGAYTGITASVALKSPMDLVFLSLAGATPPAAGAPYSGGPALGIRTGSATRFELDAGVNFLGAAFAVAGITVGRGPNGGTELNGQLTSAAVLTWFGHLSFGFTYRTVPGPVTSGGQAEKLAFHGWPELNWERDIVDFLQAIKSLADTSAGSSCGQLAGLVTNKVFHSTYNITPSVSVSGTDLVFSLSGDYQLKLAGIDHAFVDAQLPAAVVNIPATTPLDALADQMADGIATASAQIAQGLLNDRENTAMLLGVLLGPQAVSVALELACNGLVDGAVAAASEAAATVLEAGLTALTMASALDAVRASLAKSGQDDNGPGIGTPRLLSASYQGGAVSAVSATWSGARRATDYTLQVLEPDGGILVQGNFHLAAGGSLTVNAAALGGSPYQVRVRGSRSPDGTGPWSNSIQLARPVAPVPALTYDGTSLTAAWADAHMDGYQVRFTDPAGQPMGGDESVAEGVLQAQRRLTDPVAGEYAVRLLAVRTGQFPGDWGLPVALRVAALAAPAVTSVTDDGTTLTVAWIPGTPTGANYDVRVGTGGNWVLVTSVTATAAALDAGGLQDGTAYAVRVRAHGDGVVSLWSERVFTPARVPAPASVALAVDAGALTATWAAVPSSVYRAELIDADAPTQPIGALDAGAALAGTFTRTDGQPLTEGGKYRVRVRADIGGNLSPWTTSADLRYVALPGPVSPALAAESTALTLAWKAQPVPAGVPAPLRYDVRLFLDSQTDPVGETDAVTGTSMTPKRADERLPGIRETYYAKIRTTASPYTSAWWPTGSVTIMDTILITGVSCHAQVLTVDWTPSYVPTATIEVEITPASGAPAWSTSFIPPPAGQPPAQGRIDLTGRNTGGACSVRVRAVSPESHGGWSPPVRAVLLQPTWQPSVTYDGTNLTVTWFPMPEATGYRTTVTDAHNRVAATQDTDASVHAASIPAAGLQRGITYAVTVTVMAGVYRSPASPAAPATLLDPPAPVTAWFSGGGISASWPAVPGATVYTLAITEPDGRPVTTLDGLTRTSVNYWGNAVVTGLSYLVQVAARADIAGPYSAPVPVAKSDFTC
ncbi:MAG: hypothetical protein JWM19_6054, partial [Actinomycetia bacterium]|nr:hypothetical protein [Actinomycetes bacterium]